MLKAFKYFFSLIFSALIGTLHGFSQIEGLIMEKYYLAGGADTMTNPNPLLTTLPDSSLTYRFYLDLEENSELMGIYGTENHPISISSSEPFFNHSNNFRGQTFGTKNDVSQFAYSTILLDTWITMGFTARGQMGILKDDDPNGAVDQIKNNINGALQNEDTIAGIPITQSDGMVPTDAAYDFQHRGILDLEQKDTTIFAVPLELTKFESTDFIYQVKGVDGVKGPDASNRILLFQFTTKGDIVFTINAMVKDAGGNIIKYVALDTLIGTDERFNSYLRWPLVLRRGCTDPNYAEYDPKAVIDDGSCKEAVVYGCMDTSACNYDPNANVHLDELCCYDSQCELDLATVCEGTVYGCMDPEAANYNPRANRTSEIDGCCYRKGCMNKNYIEYDRTACYQDSTDCVHIIVEGCTNPDACNYNPVANRSVGCDFSSCSGGNKSYHVQGKEEKGTYSLSLFPNPFESSFTFNLSLSDPATMEYEIRNTLGQLVHRNVQDIVAGTYRKEIDLSDVSAGIYLVTIKVNDGISYSRLLKY